MNENYGLIQYFLDYIKEFAISNPDKEISSDFIYSNLIGFNVRNDQSPYMEIKSHFNDWKERYSTNKNIDVFEVFGRNFLWFIKGKLSGNEIKLYVPLDSNHIVNGANQIFDFIAESGFDHESKIASKIRNDDLVIRVNKMEDALKIIDFVNNNDYIKEGLIKVNPFLPNFNGVGIAMDNTHSYNSTISSVISEFISNLREYNKLNLVTVDQLNNFIKYKIDKEENLDLKDIYTLLSKTTTKDFKLNDFFEFSDNKLADKYTAKRERITDPKFYFEQAIISTNIFYPENSKIAIFEYLKGNPNYFTNKGKERQGLIKYVSPGDLINIMRSELSKNNIPIPNNDNELIDNYLNILLNKENNFQIENSNTLFEEIENAYINTLEKYDIIQANMAVKALIQDGILKYFSNVKGDRDKLKKSLVGVDVKKIILQNIDINDLDINNIEAIVERFNQVVFPAKMEYKK